MIRAAYFLCLIFTILFSVRPSQASYFPGRSPVDGAEFMERVGAFNSFYIEATPNEMNVSGKTNAKRSAPRLFQVQLAKSESAEIVIFKITDPSGKFEPKEVQYLFENYTPKKIAHEGISFLSSESDGPQRKIIISAGGEAFNFTFVDGYSVAEWEIRKSDFYVELPAGQPETASSKGSVRSIESRGRLAVIHSDRLALFDVKSNELIRTIDFIKGFEPRVWFEGASLVLEYENGARFVFARSSGRYMFSQMSPVVIRERIMGSRCFDLFGR